MKNKLEEARRIIDEVDAEMAHLFVKRMRAAEIVHEYKRAAGLPVLDAKREKAVLEQNAALVEDAVLKEYYIDYLKGVMSISRAYQSRLQSGLRVAYSGVEGAFAHIAAERVFPQGVCVPCPDFKAAYNAVLCGDCDAAVLPVENSYAGEVGQTLDLIFSGSLFINGIYELEIHQHLLGLPEATVEDIRKVTSHPQALSQCRSYLDLRGFETEESANTALSAKAVAEKGDKSFGAVASAKTAELYGLKIVEANINKSGENTTRFAVLSKVRAAAPSHLSTVLMLTVKHETGSLANAVSIIARHGYSMTALRSRPMKQYSWQYYFYVELDGRVDTDAGKKMLEELAGVCDELKVAGTFAPHAQI